METALDPLYGVLDRIDDVPVRFRTGTSNDVLFATNASRDNDRFEDAGSSQIEWGRKSEMGKGFKQVFAAAGIGAALLSAILLPSTAGAYGPSTMYTAPAGTPAPGVLYARAMQASNGKMYATWEWYSKGVSMFPIWESLDSGRTWKKVGDVKDTHKGWGMRWQPQLYQLPQAIGNMPAGTLLAAGQVLPYDRSKCEIAMYKSNDEGRTWTYVSTIAVGTQANPGSDPVWEPFLMVVNNKLYCFYSDERDPAYGQKLVHQSTTDGVKWSSVVNDVAITGQRPGMVVVTQMPNGNFLMVYEIIGVGGAWFKTSSNIESWNPSDRGTAFDTKGSSPYAVTMGNSIILSSAGNGNLYTNSNNGVGAWTQISSPVGTGYSRCIVPLNNGRLFVINAGWNGTGLNKVTYADMAFGCAPTAIVPSTKVNDGPWRNSTSDTVNVGGTLAFGPQPNVATGWSWSGPNGYTATTREITLSNVATNQAGAYTATYTNSSGCKSTQKFFVTVKEASSILTIRAKGSHNSNQLRLEGAGPNAEIRISDLNGRTVHTQPFSMNELVLPSLKTGVYVVDVRRDQVLLDRKSFFLE